MHPHHPIIQRMNTHANTKAPKGQKQSVATYRGIRDPITNDATASPPSMFSAQTDSNGKFANQFMLSPLGIIGPVFTSAASGSPVTINKAVIFAPLLPWLYNASRNFERYRITRAVLIFVGSVGSNATGQIMMDSTTDSQDLVTPATFSTSTGGKIFDLASSANKEFRFQCDVDSSWKKVSGQTFSTYNTSTISFNNSVNDLLFTCPVLAIQAGPANTNCGSFYVEYDVQFRDPISFAANA